MATQFFTPILGKRMRVTTLDDFGNVPASATVDSLIVTDGFISVNISAETDDGAEIITKKADGSMCVNEKLANSLKRLNLEVEFCGVNPSLLSFMTNAETYTQAADVVGLTVAEGAINKKFAFELWTGLSAAVAGPGEEASGYLLLPFLNAGLLGDMVVDGENAVSFSMTGAYTKGGNAWGVGPYNVILGGTTVNEVQVITITGTPTGGTFQITYDGQTTAAIAYNATSSAVQAALEALSNIAPGDVVVSGGPGPATPYTFTFGGTLAGQDVTLMTTTDAFTGGTAPAAAVTTPTPGVAGVASPLPTALDALDHLLLISTLLAPPPSAVSPQAMP